MFLILKSYYSALPVRLKLFGPLQSPFLIYLRGKCSWEVLPTASYWVAAKFPNHKFLSNMIKRFQIRRRKNKQGSPSFRTVSLTSVVKELNAFCVASSLGKDDFRGSKMLDKFRRAFTRNRFDRNKHSCILENKNLQVSSSINFGLPLNIKLITNIFSKLNLTAARWCWNRFKNMKNYRFINLKFLLLGVTGTLEAFCAASIKTPSLSLSARKSGNIVKRVAFNCVSVSRA